MLSIFSTNLYICVSYIKFLFCDATTEVESCNSARNVFLSSPTTKANNFSLKRKLSGLHFSISSISKHSRQQILTGMSQFNALMKKLDSADVLKQVQLHITDLYNQIKIVKPDYFKPEHQEEYLRLRGQCRDLINKTRGFCDKAIPPLEYAIAQYSSSNPVNVKDLAEKVTSLVNPKEVLEQCEEVENAIITFNERLQLDESYKKTEVMSFLSIGSGLALGIACLIGFFYAPARIAATAAAAGSGSSIMFLAIDLFFSG